MQFPESWLRAFCNPPLDTQQVADTLTMGGFEVEEVRPVAPPFSGVVVGHILSAQPHPDADRLRVCTVDVAAAEPLQIVCGAPNARPGLRVPCAVVGAQLPPPAGSEKPFVIRAARLRGVQSHGMLCSARELGISEDHEGLMELPADLPAGQDLRAALDLDENIFIVKLTPNLGHALSVYGIARELSALTGAPLVTPQIPTVAPGCDDVLPVRVSAPDLCGRFSGRIIRSVNTQARTPDWMVRRLARCGQRSVAPLVDISNYVLFEYGRPSHIFDLGRIEGGLDVRWGCGGEQLKLLNGNTIAVDEEVGVIADANGLESLAGIMGGDATAVTPDTSDIYVEAAFWWPDAVAGRSRRYNFATEAGHRFERGVDPALTVEHIERITQLVLDICGTPDTRCGPVDDQQPNMPQRPPVGLRVARASQVIGVPLSQQQCAQVFQRLGFDHSEQEGSLQVQPPMYRFDLEIEADLIEEVARIIGYDRLPDTPPRAALRPRQLAENRRNAFSLRHQLARLGYLETINFSFVSRQWERDLAGNEHPIELRNPIASQLEVMRSSLLGSLLQVAKRNLDRRADQFRVFEIGRVFRRDDSVHTDFDNVQGVAQPMHVAGLILGGADQQGWEGRQPAADFYDIKGDAQALFGACQPRFVAARHPAFHPGRCAAVHWNGQTVGYLGQLHPRWAQQWEFPRAPMLFELALEPLLERGFPQPRPVPRQVPVLRDIAVVVADQVTHDQILGAIGDSAGTAVLADATVFDIYKPAPDRPASDMAAGEKSVALHLLLHSPDDSSMAEDDIEAAVADVLARLEHRCGARLRG